MLNILIFIIINVGVCIEVCLIFCHVVAAYLIILVNPIM